MVNEVLFEGLTFACFGSTAPNVLACGNAEICKATVGCLMSCLSSLIGGRSSKTFRKDMRDPGEGERLDDGIKGLL